MAVDLILFDMDGVLYSSEPILYSAYVSAVEAMNRDLNLQEPVPTESQIFQFVGMPVKQLFFNLFPDLDEQTRQRLNQHVLAYLVDHIGRGTVFEGVAELLARLAKKVPLAIASNGRRAYIDAITEHFNLKQHLVPGYYIADPLSNKVELLAAYRQGMSHFSQNGQFEAPQSTPSEYDLNLVASREKGDVDPQIKQNPQILMIGDRFGDKQAAFANHCHFIGVTYGHGEQSELIGADFLANDIVELAEIITNEYLGS